MDSCKRQKKIVNDAPHKPLLLDNAGLEIKRDNEPGQRGDVGTDEESCTFSRPTTN